ncbi:hypothetical protein ACLKA7_009977 [Drosophila subpalustris]
MELPRTTSTTTAGNGVGDKLKLNEKQKQELGSCCTGVASVEPMQGFATAAGLFILQLLLLRQQTVTVPRPEAEPELRHVCSVCPRSVLGVSSNTAG